MRRPLLLLSALALPAALLPAQGIVEVALRGGPAFAVDRAPELGALGAEAAVALRLGSHTRLGLIAGLTRYNDDRTTFEGFYDPATGGFEFVCPGNCTWVPARRESRYRDYAQWVVVTFRVAPGSGGVTRPWVELGVGAYRLGHRFTDRGVRAGGDGEVFANDGPTSWGWGPGASLGAGTEWFPGAGRVGVSAGARLHGAVASVRGETQLAPLLSLGVGVVIR